MKLLSVNSQVADMLIVVIVKPSTMNMDYVNYILISFQVIDLGGEAITSRDYFRLGRVTEFQYGAKLGTVFRKLNGEKLSYTKYVCFYCYHVGIFMRIFEIANFNLVLLTALLSTTVMCMLRCQVHACCVFPKATDYFFL